MWWVTYLRFWVNFFEKCWHPVYNNEERKYNTQVANSHGPGGNRRKQEKKKKIIQKSPQCTNVRTKYFTRFNPILTGGGSIWPPPARNPRLPRDRRRSRHAFSWLFSFKSCASFDTKFAKIGPSVARSRDVLYSHVGTKFAQNLHFA